MTRQEIIDAITALASDLDAIKTTTTNLEFYNASDPALRIMFRALKVIKHTEDA